MAQTVVTIDAQNTDGFITSAFDGAPYGYPVDCYERARENTGGATLAVDTAATTAKIGQQHEGGGGLQSWQYQTFLRFDTSVIPANAVIKKIELKVMFSYVTIQDPFVIEARSYDWGATLTTADYVKGSLLSSKQLLGKFNAADKIVYEQYCSFITSPEFQDNINRSGFTPMILVSQNSTDGYDEPYGGTAKSNFHQIYTSNATTGKKPQLVITYEIPSVTKGIKKEYQYKVYRPDGTFLTTWKDVVSDPENSQEINTAGTGMAVRLQRKADDLSTEIDFKNVVVVTVFDEDAPDGRLYFTGYISQYAPLFDADGEYIDITLLNYGAEWSDMVLEGIANTTNSIYQAPTIFDPGLTTESLNSTNSWVAQRIRATATPITGIYLMGGGSAPRSAGLYSDNAGVPGTKLANLEFQPVGYDNSVGAFYLRASIPNGITISVGQDYHIVAEGSTATLADDFTDGVKGDAWFSFGTGVSEAPTYLELTVASGGANYKGYETSSYYDFTGQSVSAQLLNAGNQALVSLEVYPVFVYKDANNSLFWMVSGGFIRAYKKVAGVLTQISSAAYNAGVHRYFRIREASGTTYWDYSTNGYNWTNLTSAANPITITSVDFQLQAGVYASEASSTVIQIDRFNLGGGSDFAFFKNTSNLYADGYKSVSGDGGSTWTTVAGEDMYFIVETGDISTTITYTNKEIAFIVQDVIDKYNLAGGRVQYTPSSIELTGTMVDYTFRGQSILEVIRKLNDLAPAGFYWYLDPADNTLYFKKTRTTRDHVLTLGSEIVKIQPIRIIEGVVNKVYFTGGEIGTNQNLYKKYVNQASIDLYGTQAKAVSDNRVTSSDTAQRIASKILTERSVPTLKTSITVPDSSYSTSPKGYDIESIRVGQIIGFDNVGAADPNLWDVALWDVAYWDYNLRQLGTLSLQVVRLSYSPKAVIVECASVAADVAKIISDNTRDIKDIQTQNNPSTPS